MIGVRASVLEHIHTPLTLDEIAERVGVSRERVRQILISEKVTLSSQRRWHESRRPKTCSCGCGRERPRRRKYATRECKVQDSFRKRYVFLVCEMCGRKFPRLRSEVRYKKKKGCRHTFCSRPCLGKYCGIHNRKKKPRPVDS